MSFNPDHLETRLPSLSGFGIVELSGPDAAAFAQAQFMNHVGALADGQWHWSGWLTPKGRVVALFALLRLAEDRLWLVLPDYPAVDLVAGLRRYVFRSKVRIETRADWVACADPAGALPAPAAANTVEGEDTRGLLLDAGGAGGRRGLVLLPRSSPAAAAPVDEVDAAWRLFDLRHGLPRLGAAQAEAWTPHMLSLDRLQAFSVKKGCYPGQEIVARTHYLGQSKRGLARLTATLALPAGDDILGADGARLGEVVCRAVSGDAHEVLAVLPLERPPGTLRLGAVELREEPVLPGLAR